jgi:hypothetical protein
MPLATTALNSYAWVATGRTTYAWGEAADCEREWGEAAEALAAAPTPVPYPWNLVGSRRAEDALNWLLEAEKKHGSVASLALANWCALTTARSRRRAHDGALAPRRGERPACTCSLRRPLPSPHRCALSLLGEVSLAAEPLSSLSRPLPSMAWTLQWGAVALVEAWTLHTSCSASMSKRSSHRDAKCHIRNVSATSRAVRTQIR